MFCYQLSDGMDLTGGLCLLISATLLPVLMKVGSSCCEERREHKRTLLKALVRAAIPASVRHDAI
jgi:hypothetical protein